MTATPSALPSTSEAEVLPVEAWPDVESLVTEDDTPVDNIFSEKQQRLLTEPLYSSWSGPGEGRPFLALANGGLFYMVREPPLVPDVMLSLDVQAPQDDVWAKHNRSYFLWEYGKPPEVVIEIVSNQKGHEAERKLRDYARIAVAYYVIFDPARHLRAAPLRVYRLPLPGSYQEADPGAELEGVGLRLVRWQGEYEGMSDEWLRWADAQGALIPTGAERAQQAEQRAEQERQRAERLVAQLRALGIEPEDQ